MAHNSSVCNNPNACLIASLKEQCECEGDTNYILPFSLIFGFVLLFITLIGCFMDVSQPKPIRHELLLIDDLDPAEVDVLRNDVYGMAVANSTAL